jgi:tRNA threonylcarbamoyladenosine biosynthesis protein TsaE
MEAQLTWQLPDIRLAAKKILETCRNDRIFAFYGEMGVGKTTFIKALCRELNVQDRVSSPSFGLINEYRIPEQESVFHFDFYRIEKPEEIFDIGYEDYFFSGSYCFIEWPEMAETLLPPQTLKFRIKRLDQGTRCITMLR